MSRVKSLFGYNLIIESEERIALFRNWDLFNVSEYHFLHTMHVHNLLSGNNPTIYESNSFHPKLIGHLMLSSLSS